MRSTSKTGGTRFLLYPQSPFGNPQAQLETITISTPQGQVGDGPADHRAYTLVPVDKPFPYGVNGGVWDLPPWRGGVWTRATPGRDGHFDHLRPGSLEFEAAHLFGAVRFVLDIWERYRDEAVVWHFADAYERLELSILEGWPNAHLGFGFLEVGELTNAQGRRLPYSLNFDIIAHEVGHAVLMGMTGAPDPARLDGELQAFHEASADFVALISALHFSTVRTEVLQATGGNLDGYNHLSRFAEFASTQQVRMASNSLTLHEFSAGWRSEHELSQPLLGALFDTLIDIYHNLLLERDLITSALESLADEAVHRPELMRDVQRQFARAFRQDPQAFEAALLEARDSSAMLLLRIWSVLALEDNIFAQLGHLADTVRAGPAQQQHLVIAQAHFQARSVGAIRPGPRILDRHASEQEIPSRFLVPGNRVNGNHRYRDSTTRRRRGTMREFGI